MPVVDANVALAWAVPSSRTEAALRVLAAPGDITAPALLVQEVTNAVWLMARQGHVSPAEAEAIRTDALAPVSWLASDAHLAARALAIATELDHPAYDAFYIAAAEAADTQLVTADRRLLAKTAGSAFADRIIELGT
ncbi:MAG: hypothetical protein COW29_05385 [Rhodobacterales bacterium CG15_BIG_FIL_POST_REV_8_21_14_020_59_13]|nr:MAG: hypothetical protein COW29_05385 [Rhodobacterales bacterium CG15_BIG_FIL_POST_REV_8_21_14_020_59_13]